MSWDVAAQAARHSYGRLLALLSARTRDIASAEDALAEAFVAALEQWPRDGVPVNPDAWLLTAARRRLTDRQRRDRTREQSSDDVLRMARESAERALTELTSPFPDQRLALLFICAHPAIDEAARTPLMLQTVLGLDAARIASAMRVAPKTMGQRLWRAKQKIRGAGIPFEVPEPAQFGERLAAVLEAIYASYGSGWEDVTGDDPRLKGMTDEAIWLGRLIVEMLPDEPEPLGLLALMLFSDARRGARRDAQGHYVPLTQQDATRWSSALIEEAERVLAEAALLRQPGPYQFEAAIQSAHVDGARRGRVDHEAVAQLYGALVEVAPTLGAHVAHAAAVARVRGAARGIELLEALPRAMREEYQPFWATRGHLLLEAGRAAEAREAFQRAIGLTEDAALREFLVGRMGEAG